MAEVAPGREGRMLDADQMRTNIVCAVVRVMVDAVVESLPALLQAPQSAFLQLRRCSTPSPWHGSLLLVREQRSMGSAGPDSPIAPLRDIGETICLCGRERWCCRRFRAIAVAAASSFWRKRKQAGTQRPSDLMVHV
jgi:hypothetical protein